MHEPFPFLFLFIFFLLRTFYSQEVQGKKEYAENKIEGKVKGKTRKKIM